MIHSNTFSSTDFLSQSATSESFNSYLPTGDPVPKSHCKAYFLGLLAVWLLVPTAGQVPWEAGIDIFSFVCTRFTGKSSLQWGKQDWGERGLQLWCNEEEVSVNPVYSCEQVGSSEWSPLSKGPALCTPTSISHWIWASHRQGACPELRQPFNAEDSSWRGTKTAPSLDNTPSSLGEWMPWSQRENPSSVRYTV